MPERVSDWEKERESEFESESRKRLLIAALCAAAMYAINASNKLHVDCSFVKLRNKYFYAFIYIAYIL